MKGNTTISNSQSSSNGGQGFNLDASDYTIIKCVASKNATDCFSINSNSSIVHSEAISNGNGFIFLVPVIHY